MPRHFRLSWRPSHHLETPKGRRASLTGGKRCCPECPKAVAQLHITMHPRVFSQVPHDDRAVHSSSKQQEGLEGAQAATSDLGGQRALLAWCPGPPREAVGHEAGLGSVCVSFLSVCQAPLSPISKANFYLSIYSLHHQKLSSSPKTDTSKSYCSLPFWWNQ